MIQTFKFDSVKHKIKKIISVLAKILGNWTSFMCNSIWCYFVKKLIIRLFILPKFDENMDEANVFTWLATSVLEDIPVIVFLVNNFSLGMVAQWQRTFYEKRMIGIDLKKCPDYVKLAESYGAQGIRAQSLDELEKAIKTGLSSDVTTVIDIPIDPEEDVLPFVAPGTSLKEMILPS